MGRNKKTDSETQAEPQENPLLEQEPQPVVP